MEDYRYYLNASDRDSDQGSVESVSTNATADNLPGTGRTIGIIYCRLGRRLEGQLGRVAETLGRGPRVTAIRIKKRREVITSETARDLLAIKAENKKLKKDCKRLIKYATSSVPSTSRQALDRITDFAFSDKQVRELLNSMDATRIIGHFHKNTAAWVDSDGMLLNSSRKALVSLADAEIHGLAWELDKTIRAIRNGNQVFDAVRVCLSDSSRSFLLLRYIARIVMDFERARNILLENLLDDLLMRFSENPEAFEWDMVDTLLGPLFAYLVRENSFFFFGLSFLGNTFFSMTEFILWFAERLPKTIKSEMFQPLLAYDGAVITERFLRAHEISRSVLTGIARRTKIDNIYDIDLLRLQDMYPNPDLYPLLFRLACPPDLIMGQILDEWTGKRFQNIFNDAPYVIPPVKLETFCRQLAFCTDDENNVFSERARHNVEVLLSMDGYCRAAILKSLSGTTFGSSSECESLVKETEDVCVAKARKAREEHWSGETVFRHCDIYGNLVHIVHKMFYQCQNGACVTTQRLQLPSEDGRLWLRVSKAIPFSTHYSPLLAGHDAEGEPMYIANYRIKGLWNYTAISEREWSETVFSQEGTRYEVYVLRYTLEMQPSIVDDGQERLDATGPYAWSPLNPDGGGLEHIPFTKWERDSEGYLGMKIREALERDRKERPWCYGGGTRSGKECESEDEGERGSESEDEREGRYEAQRESERGSKRE